MKEELLLIFSYGSLNISTLKSDLKRFGFRSRNILVNPNEAFLETKKDERRIPYVIFMSVSYNHENNHNKLLELLDRFPEAAVVSLSTNTTEEHALKTLEYGASDCLNLDDYRYNHLKKVITKLKVRKDYLKRIALKNTERLKLFLQNPKPLFVLDLNSEKFLKTNQAARKKYGYSKREFEELTVRDLYPKEEIEKLNTCLEKLKDLNQNYTHKGIWKHITKWNEEIVVEIISYRTKFMDNDVLFVLAMDITEKYKAEQEREENRKYLDAIFHNVQNAIILIDDNGNYIDANEAACQLLKYSKSELLNLHFRDVVVFPEDQEKVSKRWNSFRKNTKKSGTISLKRKDREIVFADYNAEANILPGIHLSVLTDTTKSVIDRHYEELLSNIYASILLVNDFPGKQINILKCICEFTGWDYAEFWIYSDIHDSFSRSVYYCNPEKDSFEEFANKSQTIAIKADDNSLVSLSIKKNKPIWIKNLKRSKQFDRRGLLPTSNQFSGLSIPYSQSFSSKPLGGLTMIKSSTNGEPPKKDKNLINLLKNISETLCSEIEKLWFQDDISRVFKNSTNLYGTLSPDSTILELNPAFVKLMNYSSSELTGEKLLRFIHPNDQHRIKRAFEISENSAKERKVEFRILTNGGYFKWINGVFIPDHLSKRVFISGKDITETKFAQRKLELSEKHYKALAQGGSDMIAVMDKNGTYKHLSPSVQSNLQFDPKELAGKNTYEFIHPADISYTKKQMESLRYNESIFTKPIRYKNAKGEWRWLESVLTNLLDDPAVMGIVANSRDVTQRIVAQQEKEKLYEDLKKYNEELLQFTYITSHNLRAPISNLMAISKLIDTSTIQNKQTAFLVEGIKKSSHALNDTVSDLVTALAAREKKDIKLENCDLMTIWEQCCELFKSQIAEIDPEMHVDFTNHPMIFYNKTYLRSIFLNLLSNSLKYHSPVRKLQIRIVTIAHKNNISLEFSDNGIGFDLEKHKNKIFGFHQRFHDHVEGKGLGLFLIKTQIASLGGSIDVESEVNKGTKFIIKLTELK